MEKPAAPQYPIHDLIRRRWSPRAFAAKAVPIDALQGLLEAARWAASSYNEQPWRYLIATREAPDAFQQMVSCLMPLNQLWAKDVPVLMLSFMKKTFTHNNTPNRVAMHDVGAASAQLTVEATARGLFVHQMGGILPDRIREVYAVPEDFEAVSALAIGYPGDPDQLPEKLRNPEREPRSRKPPEELFFTVRWHEPASFR